MALAPQRQPYRLMHDEYLTIERAAPERHAYLDREAHDAWMLRMVTGLEAALHVATLQWAVALAEMYERVEFPACETTS